MKGLTCQVYIPLPLTTKVSLRLDKLLAKFRWHTATTGTQHSIILASIESPFFGVDSQIPFVWQCQTSARAESLFGSCMTIDPARQWIGRRALRAVFLGALLKIIRAGN